METQLTIRYDAIANALGCSPLDLLSEVETAEAAA